MQNKLTAQRTLIVRILVANGVICTAGLWAFEISNQLISNYDRYGYPFLMVIFSLSLATLLIRPEWQRRAEWLAYLGFALYCVAAVLSFSTLDPATRLYTIANTLQWMPLMYITAFIFFRKWEAIAAATTAFALAIASLLWLLISGEAASGDLVFGALIVNSYVVHLLTLIALSLFILTNQAFERMRDQAVVLESAAFSDSLTGIANRRSLERILTGYAARPTHPMALILLDMDNFKQVNDAHGHVFGDRVLQAVVERLLPSLRGSDVLGRWGGDEFLVLASDTSMEEARLLAERLRVAASSLPPAVRGGVTLSAGVAPWDGSGGLEEALRRVDRALYAAKGQGRDRTALEQPASS